jgi:alanyl-tRNA synthetase
VLRRIMRRAMRHAHLLGTREPLMHRLTSTLVSQMGAAYPELARAQALMSETLLLEETRFRQTLEKGLRLLDEACSPLQPSDTLSGEVAFKLYDTYGFPYDLTEDALRERGMRVDRTGFDTAMAGQKARARAAWAGSGAQATDTLWFDLAQTHGATDFIGYATLEAQAQVLSLVQEGTQLTQAQAGDDVLILANQTPFYGESGGQMGDSGMLTTPSGARVTIEDTQKPLGLLHIHKGRVLEGTLSVGEAITLSVDATRRAQLRASHSATHLLHAALRARLGDHVTQKGSLVSPGRLRFDIAHPKALTLEELAEVERNVNACIATNSPVTTRLMTPDAAVAAGALALFGEKYGEEVRVVSMGDAFSVELCGGTHVRATGDIGLFKLVSESAVAAGVRRLEALTGSAALAYVSEQEALLKHAASQLKVAVHELPARLTTLLEERKRLERDLAAAKRELALSQAGHVQVETLGTTRFMGQSLEGLSAKDLRSQIEGHLAELGEGVVCLVALEDGRASVGVGVSPGLTTLTPPLSAVDLVRLATNALGGQGGGGRATFAQGGGPNADQATTALEAVRQALREAPAKL